MIVLSRRLRLAAPLAMGALLLPGVSACGSSHGGDVAADPAPVVTSAASPAADASSPSASATESASGTATPSADGIAPATITIDSPVDGTSASTTLTVSGMANSPEANVPWRIDSATDGVLVSGFATAEGWLDKAYPWTTSVDVSALQPGTYTFTARVDDTSNKEGTKPPSATITFVKK